MAVNIRSIIVAGSGMAELTLILEPLPDDWPK
jgi:hypothetical protein